MIIVDVSVPVIGKVYDFSLDEDVSVDILSDEIADLIIQREGISSKQNSKMLLYSASRQCILERHKSLSENGIVNGDKLILV